MRKLLLSFSLLLSLSACSNNIQTVNTGLTQLQGKTIDDAIAVLGYPNAEQDIAGKTAYIWDRNEVFTSPGYVTGPSFGGSVGTSGTSVGIGFYAPQITRYSCRIRLITDDDKRIIDSDLQGDGSGCAPYAKRLEPLVPESTK